MSSISSASSSASSSVDLIRAAVVSTPDFPKPGIVFRDFLPILLSPSLTRDLVDFLFQAVSRHLPTSSRSSPPPVVVGLDSRGFLIGPLLAQRLQAPFVPIRKKGKLPPPTETESYNLEYGSDAMEISKLSVTTGQSVVIIDDLLATGGTMRAAEALLERIGAKVVACLVVIELPDLGGRKKLKAPLESILTYEGD